MLKTNKCARTLMDGVLIPAMWETLKERRLDIHEQETEYQGEHRKIHEAINLLLPEHNVGVARDSALVGNSLSDYELAYNCVFSSSDLVKTLRSIAQECYLDAELGKFQTGVMIFSEVARVIELLQCKSVPGYVISNAVHDALHDLLMDRVFVLGRLMTDFRRIARMCYYRSIAQPELPREFEYRLNYPFVNTECINYYVDNLRVLMSQLQEDLGTPAAVVMKEIEKEVE